MEKDMEELQSLYRARYGTPAAEVIRLAGAGGVCVRMPDAASVLSGIRSETAVRSSAWTACFISMECRCRKYMARLTTCDAIYSRI